VRRETLAHGSVADYLTYLYAAMHNGLPGSMSGTSVLIAVSHVKGEAHFMKDENSCISVVSPL
jgi:hypothetical protein